MASDRIAVTQTRTQSILGDRNGKTASLTPEQVAFVPLELHSPTLVNTGMGQIQIYLLQQQYINRFMHDIIPLVDARVCPRGFPE